MRSYIRTWTRFVALWIGIGLSGAIVQPPQSAAQQQEVADATFVFKTVGQRQLKILVHHPPDWKASDARPVMVFFFGGGWNSGSVGQFQQQAEYFASRGLVTARADYRVKSRDAVTPDKCVEDARSAVRWVRQNAARLGIDPQQFIVSGGSAGGHLAACMMISESVEAESDDRSVSTIPQAMVLFNPVLNFHHEGIVDRLGDNRQLASKISPIDHLDKDTPPALILFGTDDRLKIHGDEYWKKAKSLGVRADAFLAQGQGHGFFNRAPWRERTMIAADKFLASLGFLAGEPTLAVPDGYSSASNRQRPAQRQDRNQTDRAAQRQTGAQGQNRGAGNTNQRTRASWTAMDANQDGKISRDEAQGRIKNNFKRIDANNDGFLDSEELDALAKRLFGGNSRQPSRQNDNDQASDRNRRGVVNQRLIRQTPEGVTVVPDIAYRPGESKAWRLDLAMPTERGTAPRPGLVFVHGGGWRGGDKRTGAFLQGALNYAQKGYVCITVNYRLTGEAPFPACVEDVKCAVRWFRAHAEKYNVDPSRLGGYGNSAGAHLVAMLGLVGPEADLEGDGPYQDQSSLLQAVCPSATPTDFNGWPRGLDRFGSKGSLLAGPKDSLADRAKRASPINYVSADAPPMLIIHGTADRTVHISQGDRFVEALKKAGARDVTYIRIEGAGHGVFNQNSDVTGPAMEKFFARTLGAAN